MYPHPTLVDVVIRARVAELQRSAGATAHVRRETRRHKLVAAARQGTGWLLVDMGLRLAMPGRRSRVA